MRHPGPVAWLQAHPFVADALIGALFVALGWVGLAVAGTDPAWNEPDALAVLLIVPQGAPLAWRRRAPVTVLGVCTVFSFVFLVADYPDTIASLGSLVALYTVAANVPRRRAAGVGLCFGVALFAFLVLGVASGQAEDLNFATFVANVVTFGTAWVLGDNVRNRRERLGALEERAAGLEREREENARRAVTAERTRIARELHDVVAHSVSVMVVQAGAARRVLGTDPDRAVEALASIEEVGRTSLNEMRRLLGVLRRDDQTASDLAPQPGLETLEALVTSTCEAGLPVALAIEGEPRPLPPGVGLSVYRIVQEALTNALKHAGPARAWVRLRYGEDVLDLEVLDDGRGAAANDHRDGGHGLVGMRERVHMLGGELDTGGRTGGGYQVRAKIPL